MLWKLSGEVRETDFSPLWGKRDSKLGLPHPRDISITTCFAQRKSTTTFSTDFDIRRVVCVQYNCKISSKYNSVWMLGKVGCLVTLTELLRYFMECTETEAQLRARRLHLKKYDHNSL